MYREAWGSAQGWHYHCLSLARMSHWERPIPGPYAVAWTSPSSLICGSSAGVSRQIPSNHKAAGSHCDLTARSPCLASWDSASWLLLPCPGFRCGAEKSHLSSSSHTAFGQRPDLISEPSLPSLAWSITPDTVCRTHTCRHVLTLPYTYVHHRCYWSY